MEDWEKYRGKRIEDIVEEIVPANLLDDGRALQVQGRYMLVKLPRAFWEALETMVEITEIPLEDIVSFGVAGNKSFTESFLLKALENLEKNGRG